MNKKQNILWFVIVILILIVVTVIVHGSKGSADWTTATSTPTGTSTEGGLTTSVKAYFVAIGDGGKSGDLIGCGDSIVPVEITVNPTHIPLHDALTILLSDKRHGIESGLYNVFSNSNLVLGNATIVNGVATIPLTGTLSLGGECDDPRAMAELEYTAKQFASVKSVVITLNGKSFESVTSAKGE